MTAVGNQDEISQVRAYMQSLQEEIAGLQIYLRIPTKYPFDLIGLALVSKAFSISNALLVLLESGFPDEAYGLSRSLVECALTLRFLTQDHKELNQRTWNYVRFDKADKQYWMHYALQISTTDEMRQKIYERAKQFNWEPDAEGVQKRWSGNKGSAWKVNLDEHPLDNDAFTELSKKSEYATGYHAPSSYVHCYSPAVGSFLPANGEVFEVQESSGKWANPRQKTLFILICYLHSCVAYTLFGMNLERTQRMNNLFSETLQSLLPYLPISDFPSAHS